jgi:ABC-type antimicrobial peptide transport system permease subunit
MLSIGRIFARRRRYDDLSISIQEHLDEKIDELMEHGLSREAAELRARREFGNVALIRERSREFWQWPTLESIWSDLRFALRQLRKTPGMAVLAILTLALGVGANTAMFTVIENVLLRPLPYASSSRMIFIGPPNEKTSFGSTSWLDYRDIRAQSKLLQDVAGYSADIGVMETQDSSQSVVAPRVTTNLFSMVGAQPLLGRTFSQAEGQAGGPAAVLLSENLWRQSFHADLAIVGRTVKVGGVPRTIVGVMPDSFRFPESVGPDVRSGIWLPLQPSKEMLNNRGYYFFNVVAELRPGVSLAQSQQELDAIATRIRQTDSEHTAAFRATPYQEALTGSTRPVLYSLFAALALVLLIACVNVSNLLLARSLSRQQEFAVRAALGAGRVRLIRQVLCEGLTLSLFGCGAGILLAEAILVAVRKLPEGTIPRADTISIHWTVVLVLAAIALLATVLSSLLPALLAARANPQAALQSATRGVGAHSVKGKLSGWLVAGEVALSTLLLVGTGLLFHTLWNLEKSQLGFDATHLTNFTAMPADAVGFSNIAASADAKTAPVSVATATYQPVLDRIRHVPGVAGAALITTPPLSGTGIQGSFAIVGQPTDSRDQTALFSAVSGDYARTMGTPVAFDRQRMIGIALVNPIDKIQICRLLFRQPRRLRKTLKHGIPRRRPDSLKPANDWRFRSPAYCEYALRNFKRVCFSNVIPCRLHRRKNLASLFRAADTTQCTCQTAGNSGVSAIQQRSEQFRCIADARQNDLGFNRVANIKGLRYSNQRSRRRKDSQAIADNQVVARWKLLFLQVVNRCAKEQLDRVVMAFRTVNDCLSRNNGVFSMEQKRLFRRKMPVFPETFVAI